MYFKTKIIIIELIVNDILSKNSFIYFLQFTVIESNLLFYFSIEISKTITLPANYTLLNIF
jgi:hypothetical protein